MSKIGTAVVGYGMGAYHCKQIKQAEDFDLIGICDLDPDRRAQAEKELNVKTYASLDETLNNSEVELVVLAVPHHVHAPMTIQALSAGRHVLVEKVMSLSVQEADAMIEAARKAGRTLTVFQNRREDSDIRTVRRVMESGMLGDVYQIECACNYRGPHSGWRTRLAYGGGYVYDAGGHMIDQLVMLAGCRARTVFAAMQRRVWSDVMDTETYANITVRFESGLVGVVDISGIYWYRKPRFLVLGEKGAFVGIADPDFGKFSSSFIETEVAGLNARVNVEPLPKEDATFYYQRLADHLLRGAELSVRPEDVRESVKIIQAAYESDKTGKSVDVLDW